MKPYIELQNISKSFGKHEIIKNVSLCVEQGKTVGLIGANGSGKSVLFKILCGFERPDAGNVFVQKNSLEKAAWIFLKI